MSLQEDLKKGSGASSMRLGFIVSVYTSCFGGFVLAVLDVVLNKGVNLTGVALIIGALQAFAFSAKTVSGKFEQKKEG